MAGSSGLLTFASSKSPSGPIGRLTLLAIDVRSHSVEFFSTSPGAARTGKGAAPSPLRNETHRTKTGITRILKLAKRPDAERSYPTRPHPDRQATSKWCRECVRGFMTVARKIGDLELRLHFETSSTDNLNPDPSVTLLLNTQAISKSYGATALFRNISLSINEGDRLGLIGPNGSGKSTLMEILAQRREPDAVPGHRRVRLRSARVTRLP
jgi:ABC-type glutathione transport system ATPase component